ncbi:lytic transglycosylase domain-containing protein [Novosphingobium sp.]|uniref:lytic transglycosylase domain-containing protein n=1 Tax=Novosphingobium sp. TaxID=1874826 RepID=UPI003D151C01
MAGPDFSALEQQYALPPGLLAAQQQVESHGRDVTSPAGAMGPAQLMPATARALGVNPHDPVQAADAQARLMRANLDASGGDLDRAAMMYHGGPDTRQWGPKTHAYPGKILAALQSDPAPAHDSASPAAAPADPFESALSGQSAGASQDPFETALSGGKAPADGGIPDRSSASGSIRPGDILRPAAVPGGMVSVRQVAPDQVAGPAGQPGQDGLLTSIAKGVVDVGSGINEGYDKFQTGLAGLVLRGTDALGLTSGMHDGLNKFIDDNAHARDGEFYNPDGYARPVGNFVGESIPLAPLSEIKAISAAPEAGRLAQALAKYGTLSTQGAAAGALSSGGNDIAAHALLGAATAPVMGAAIEKAAIPALRLAGKAVTGTGNAVADGLATIAGKFKPSAPTAPLENAVVDQINAGKSTAEIAEHFPWVDQNAVENWVKYRASGGNQPVSFSDSAKPPVPLDPAAVRQAMGSRGNNIGVEGSPALPQAVNDHASQLAQDGVPLDEALREARLAAIGAKPTYANVTRDPVALRAEIEGSKLDTLEGQALASQRAANNGVIVDKMADTAAQFSPNGKVPGSSEATNAAAEALAKASDTGRAAVNQAYATARAADPDALIEPTNLHSVLNSDEAKAVPASTPEGALLAQVRNTVEQGQLAHDSRVLPLGVSPDALNNIGAMANRKFGADKAVNYWIGKIAGATDQDLGQIDSLGEAWRNARQAHAKWAREFQDPAGVRNLIARDPQGNFLNANAGAKNDALWTASDSTPAVQIIKALKTNGADDAVGLIKSHVAQQAYEAATGKSGGNAVDQAGNSPVSGKAYHAFLNKVGGTKLKELYSPEEMAGLANLGHAANIVNETPAGVNNSPNTSSALANAIARSHSAGQPGKVSNAMLHGMPALGALFGHLTGAGAEAGGIGGLIIEPVAKAATSAVQRRAQAQAAKILGDELNRTASPAAARAAANENAVQVAAAQQRKATASSLARTLAAPTSTRKGER